MLTVVTACCHLRPYVGFDGGGVRAKPIREGVLLHAVALGEDFKRFNCCTFKVPPPPSR